jgi:hypothetical protein
MELRHCFDKLRILSLRLIRSFLLRSIPCSSILSLKLAALKFVAYARPKVGAILHRHHAYRVRFNSDAKYPVIEAVVEDIGGGRLPMLLCMQLVNTRLAEAEWLQTGPLR